MSQVTDPVISEDEPQPSFWQVPVLMLATFVTMLNAMALGPFLPVIANDLNTSVALLGQIPALSMLLAAFLGLFVGPLADQIGHRRALLGGLGVAVVSSIGIGLAPGYILLLIAALVGAGARAIVQPVSVAVAGSRFRGDQQRRAISWVIAGVSGAVIVGIPALTTVAELYGWRIAFASLAGLTTALLLTVAQSLDMDTARPATKLSLSGIAEAYRPLVRHRPTAGLIGASLLSSGGIWLMATYIGAFFSERFGYSIQQIGWVYMVPGVTMLLGSLLVGGRLGALPLRPLVVGTRILAGLVVCGLFILPVTALAGIGLLAVQGVTVGIAAAAVAVLLSRESPAGRATTMGLNLAALSLGIALGSALGGLLLAIADFWMLGLFSLLLYCLSSGLVWLYQERTADVVPVATPQTSR